MKINKKSLLNILALIIGPIIPMVVAAYFLFPYINTTKYQKVVKQFKKEQQSESKGAPTTEVDMIGGNSDTLKDRVFQKSIARLKSKNDYLKSVNDSLNVLLLAKDKQIKKLQVQQKTESDSTKMTTQNKKISDKQFTENMKSLLSLDIEQLSPIIKEMSDNVVVRLYEKGSSLQKRKLLQSLQANRAAKLMKEVL